MKSWATCVLPLALGGVPSGRPGLDVRQQAIVGDELRLVVVTMRHCTPFLSHSSRIADVKGWLVTIDLASTKPVAERSRVYGPLWDLPEPRSGLSFEAGVAFTPEDEAQMRDVPPLGFAADGSLQRFLLDSACGTLVREVLAVDADGAAWKRQNDVKAVRERVPPMSEDRLETPSGRWRLLRQGPIVQLYDMDRGELVDDAWLTAASAARARSSASRTSATRSPSRSTGWS